MGSKTDEDQKPTEGRIGQVRLSVCTGGGGLMGLMEAFLARARKAPRRVVLPEGDDERVVRAAGRLASGGTAHPVLLGDPGEVARLADGEPMEGVQVIDPSASTDVMRYASAYASRRPGVTAEMALRLMRRGLYFGGMMVREGDADALVAGATRPTSQVISAGTLTVGFEEGVERPSSFFIMVLPGPPERILVYADAAVTVDPSPMDLARIAVLTARNARRLLGIDPRVAMLSFSTHGSAQHLRVDRVREATDLARRLSPGLCIDGELQADAALSDRVAAKKCPGSPLRGDANVLIFPDLDSGNIAYKLTQYLAGAQAIGPIMQGFRRPVNDLSRGASVADIVAVAAVAALQA